LSALIHSFFSSAAACVHYYYAVASEIVSESTPLYYQNLQSLPLFVSLIAAR
jgi:hypothetical protein